MDAGGGTGTGPVDSFHGKVFYLYGYPSAHPEGHEAGQTDTPQGGGSRRLRRELASVGARTMESAGVGARAGCVVIPDDSSAELRASANATGLPVVSESTLLGLIHRQREDLAGGSMDAREPGTMAVVPPGRGAAGSDAATDSVSADGASSEAGDSESSGVLGLDDDEHRERTEWQQMLTSALCSQVVDGEKKRLNAQADGHLFSLKHANSGNLVELLPGHEDQPLYRLAHTELWLGCRAAIRGRTPLREKRTLESLRSARVDPVLRAVVDFSVAIGSSGSSDSGGGGGDFSVHCLAQLQRLLRRVDYVESMYPTLRALAEAKPLYGSRLFQEKLAAITSWTNIAVRMELLHTMIQRWTGSRELDLFAPANASAFSSTTAGITNSGATTQKQHPPLSSRPSLETVKQQRPRTPFVERLLKENGMKMIFEQKFLKELEEAMVSVRRDLLENAYMISETGLPVSNRYMQELLLFPPRLLQTCLVIRLQSAENLVNPPLAQVDQLIEDLREALSVACHVKRTFISVATPKGKWSPGIWLDPEYDSTLRTCLGIYFRLLHRKLQITKGSGARDFEILESQWPFLQAIVRDIDGGHYQLVLRYCQLVHRSMRLWTSILAQKLQGPESYDTMAPRDLGKWLSRALQDIRSPILKAQRLVRTIQNALTNATDYRFADPFPVLTLLVESKHVLLYTGGEWESRGVYLIGSQPMRRHPDRARELLQACIIDDVMLSKRYDNQYLLVLRTDAEFNWTGPAVTPSGDGIPYQDLGLAPGQMRLIAPGLERLDRYRQWLERIGIAEERQPWQTYTAATDEVLEALGRPLGKHSGSGAASDASGPAGSVRSATGSWNEEELDVWSEDGSEFAALRPSLDRYDRRLGRMNAPSWGTAAQRGLIEDMAKQTRGAPAQIVELARAHNPHVMREWALVKYSITRMLDALTQVPDMLRTLHLDFHEREYYEARHPGEAKITCRGANCDLLELIQEAFLFVSNTASRGSRFLDLRAERYVRLALLHMCVGWCTFIAEDCMANERRTFRWAMQALEFTMSASKSNTLQVLGRDDWQVIKAQVAGCVTLMISHFDVLGNRSEDLGVAKGRQKRREQELEDMEDPGVLLSLDGIDANYRSRQSQLLRVEHARTMDELRDRFLADECRIGRVLEVTARPEDQTLRLLASSSSNITIRWQIGRYIGGGAFGAVYVGYNLDSGELMAVKEIRFPSRPIERAPGPGGAAAANQHNANANQGDACQPTSDKIVREMEVMSMLQHPNIVTYYGIEVHREKVYLFMELCTRGSLAQMIKDQGRLDETTVKVFVVQMLRGLQYLHQSGICHRDIKCDNTLLDENMAIKLVDFGAAKVLNQQSLASRRTHVRDGASLTGTPMYMAPEVILGSNGGSVAGSTGVGAVEALRPGKLGAQDIWSLACCIVEMVMGSPPWAHLDNEWAIMYHVVSGTAPLPGASDISPEGMRFVKRCFARHPADRPQAAELLEDEWIAATARRMERMEASSQGGRLPSGSIDYTANLEYITESPSDAEAPSDAVLSARSSHRSDAGRPAGGSMMVASSVGSAASMHSPARSRRSSVNSHKLSGDLRFVNPNASSTELLYPAVLGTPEPLKSRTSGSPSSASPTHAAWPFNKGVLRESSSESWNSPSSNQSSSAPRNPLSTAGSEPRNTEGSVHTSVGSLDRLTATEEELVARYSSPSVIYQALSGSAASPLRGPISTSAAHTSGVPPSRLQHTLDMGSPAGSPAGSTNSAESVDSVSVSQFAVSGSAATKGGKNSSGILGRGSRPTSKRGSAERAEAQAGGQAGFWSTDDIQDLTETTRKAVSAMLSMPLEGADVMGVSGWLGQGNTPMELLDIDEINETVATTSQNVVRQREQQLRRQQEMSVLPRRGPLQSILQRRPGGSGESQLGYQRRLLGQMSEPLALYPLPPDESSTSDCDGGCSDDNADAESDADVKGDGDTHEDQRAGACE
ncbi:Suppressor of Sensor Kinase (SLN1) [Coemansia biformis]|uniref:Suppressor of Sensor Kinase (SLN1) n=1 Tax=Coemansia biformis TaxID=1286918 RepID=A0A9W7YH47_9FUNG|nr:Suppressor of Sensor Kinase (SLN1) [Coemansia biformis]